MKVILTKQCKGPGGVVHPAGKVIEGPDAHRLVDLGLAKPYETQAGRLAFIEQMEAAVAQPAEPQAEPEKPAEPEAKGETPNGNGNGEAAAQQSQE